MRLVSISSYICHSDYTPLGQRGTCGDMGSSRRQKVITRVSLGNPIPALRSPCLMRILCFAFVTALWYATPALGQSSSAPSGSTSDPSSNEKPYHAGVEGVTMPKCAYMPSPPYTKEAKKAKVKGVMLVEGVVGLDGRITNLRVVKALGYG